MADRAPKIIAGVGAVALLGFGLWAFFDARAFYRAAAVWPPFNNHFLHDIGAFQIGLGLTLGLALALKDALFVALAGVGAGAAVHAASHWIDRDLGGKPSDPWVMSAMAALLLIGAFLRHRGRRRTSFRRL